MTDEARDEKSIPVPGLPFNLDLADPMVYELAEREHVPMEVRYFTGAESPASIQCEKDLEAWPCTVRRAIRDADPTMPKVEQLSEKVIELTIALNGQREMNDRLHRELNKAHTLLRQQGGGE